MQNIQSLTSTFSALGDPTRFELFKLIAGHNEMCVSQLAKKLQVSVPCVSQHMKILSEAGLVTRARAGQKVCYEISTDSSSNKKLNELIFNK